MPSRKEKKIHSFSGKTEIGSRGPRWTRLSGSSTGLLVGASANPVRITSAHERL